MMRTGEKKGESQGNNMVNRGQATSTSPSAKQHTQIAAKTGSFLSTFMGPVREKRCPGAH
jgi:hypothetical protein